MENTANIKNQSDHELVEGCIAFDRRCQELFYRKFANKMYNVCLTYSENEDEAADILQEGFIKIFRKIDHFKFDGSLEGWVRKVMINSALENFRKKTKEKKHLLSYSNNQEEESYEVLEDLEKQEVIELINDLPFKAQLVLKLYAVEGYNHREIAEMMNINEGTSKSQLNRARSLMKQALMKRNVI
ncbi:MAG: sigma-70 family RNA polymerase sigma factor [Bacteroidota bacterium]